MSRYDNRRVGVLKRRTPETWGLISFFNPHGEGGERHAVEEAQKAAAGWRTVFPGVDIVCAWIEADERREVNNHDGFRGKLELVY